MRIRVTFLGVLQSQTGMETLSVELPEGATFWDLVGQLDTLVGDSLPSWAWNREERCFTPFILAMRNLIDIDDPQMPLVDGDEILIVAPAAGG